MVLKGRFPFISIELTTDHFMKLVFLLLYFCTVVLAGQYYIGIIGTEKDWKLTFIKT